MSKTAHDDDQPGLWPLPETADEPTESVSTRRNAASTSSEHQAAKQQVNLGPKTNTEALWHIDELAAHLGVPKSTIYGWRTTNYGPPAIKVGKHLRWRPAAVVDWGAKQERLTQ